MKWKKLTVFVLAMAAFGMMGCLTNKRAPSGTQATRIQESTAVHSQRELTGEPIRIGVMYALSGNNAAIGTNILRGIDFAVEDINTRGGIGGRPIEIVRGDTQGDSQIARQVANRLITEDKVHAILGCHQSTLTEIVAEICEEHKIPMITAISTVDSISTHGYDYFFRMCPMNSLYMENMFMYLKDQAEKTGKEVKTLALFADNSMIGQEAIRCAKIYAPEYGMEIIKEIQYGQGAADLTSEILALKEADADAVIAESYVSDAILLMRTLKEQDYRPPILLAKANGFTDPSYERNLRRLNLCGRMESRSSKRTGDQQTI